MGNRTGPAPSQAFLEQDWERREELPDCQVWQSKRDPQLRIESHDIFTQNSGEVERESRMFELRKRSPLLVAAYFLQLQPKEEFCSFHNKHTLFLQRVPIRLSDIEHVPYPDCLHLYDSCLKGYAQLARHIGYFPVDEGMVGINDQCVAKAWLSEDFANSVPFNTNISEEAMVGSLLEAIDRSIDPDDIPPNVPQIREYLNRGRGVNSFDAVLWTFGEFVRKYNYGQVPIRLDCIDKVGGMAVIAQREKSAKMGRSNVSNRRIGSQVRGTSQVIPEGSQVGNRVLQSHPQTKSVALIPSVNPQPIVSFNQFNPFPQQTYQSQVRSPVPVVQNGLRRSQIVALPAFPIAQNIQQVIYQPVPPPQPQVYQSVRSSQVSPPQQFTHRVSNAPKFTVQVIPGKVYPQKSSTIFLSSSKSIPAATVPAQTLENIHPIITTSQKDVIKEQPHETQDIQALINSQSGNMRSYTVEEEKYSPDNFTYERESHQIDNYNEEEPELQPYIPHAQPTTAFQTNFKEAQPEHTHQELFVSFNPASIMREEVPVVVQNNWQAQYTNSQGEPSPRDEEAVDYANYGQDLLQSANFGVEPQNQYNQIEKEQAPTDYYTTSYTQSFNQNDGKSSLDFMQKMFGGQSLANQESADAAYQPSPYHYEFSSSLPNQELLPHDNWKR